MALPLLRNAMSKRRRLIQVGKLSSCQQSRLFSHSPLMSSQMLPPWLQNIVTDSTQPPKPYAWTIDNLDSREASRPMHVGHSPPSGDRKRRVYVLGMGNLGRLYATCLSQLSAPPPITLVVHRRSLLEQWASNPGIELTRYAHLERVSNFEIEWWTEERPTRGPVREVGDGASIPNLIVATKAADAIPQVDRLRRYLDDSSSILFVQNGMSRLWPPYGALYNAYRYPDGSHPTYLHGVTTHGVFSEGPFKSVHAAPADVVVGPVCPNEGNLETANYLTKLVTTAPHLAGRAVSKSELWLLQLEKLVINMIINPLTAILRVRNGELFSDPQDVISKLMDVLLDETSHVLQALVQHESSKEILHDSTMNTEDLTRRLSTQNLRQMLHRVGDKVKHNKSSMFQDVEAGKQTEIKEFNGWLVETAESLDEALDVRCHKILIDLVQQGVTLDKADLGKRLLYEKQ